MPLDSAGFIDTPVVTEPKTDAGKVLTLARKLIERGWCSGELATTREGQPCGYADEFAAAFCSVGAFARAAWMLSDVGVFTCDGYMERLSAAIAVFREATGVNRIDEWNDAQLYRSAVLDAFSRAISLAESQA